MYLAKQADERIVTTDAPPGYAKRAEESSFVVRASDRKASFQHMDREMLLWSGCGYSTSFCKSGNWFQSGWKA